MSPRRHPEPWCDMPSCNYRWDWNDAIVDGIHPIDEQKVHHIHWSSRFSSSYPNHAPGEYINPLFGNLGASYPVDELAGIMLHEMVHSVNFGHAADYPMCYDAWNCPSGPTATRTCRMNSLPEIAEGCMSEVVQLSTDKCDPEMCTHTDEVPIYNEIIQYYSRDDDDWFSSQWKRSGECRCTRFW